MMNVVNAGDFLAAGTNRDDDTDGYARIGEVARRFDVTLRALRFYEDKGLIEPKRDGTTRLYSRRERTRLKLILLGRKIGFSLRDIKQLFDLYDSKGPNTRQLRLVLEKSERQLVRLEKQRALLDDAISDLKTLAADTRGRIEPDKKSARS